MQRALQALRSGSAGMVVAIVIFALCQINQRLETKSELADTKSTVISYILIFMLWLAWFTSMQVMFMVTDEITPIPDETIFR